MEATRFINGEPLAGALPPLKIQNAATVRILRELSSRAEPLEKTELCHQEEKKL